MNEEEFLERVLNKIAKEFGYDVASTLELMFIKKEKELDQYKNNWEELKEYIKKFPGISYASSEKVDGERLSGKLIPATKVLNKMKELEEVK
jgi:hypothetical protein